MYHSLTSTQTLPITKALQHQIRSDNHQDTELEPGTSGGLQQERTLQKYIHHPRNIMKSPDEGQDETSSNKDVSTATTATAEAPHEKKPSASASESENGNEDAANSSGPQLAFKELMDVKERETFPEQLMKILDEEMAPNAMWWMPDGKAFAIKLDKVAEEVLDKFFQGSK